MRVKTLKQTRNPEEYDLYKAALEWSLDDPIVIEDVNDLKSEYRWRNKVEPYHHQVTNLITFCRRLPVTLLADDVGLGKTISAGLIASELISRSRVSKILIVCPKIIREQWQEELETKFEIPSIIVTGGELMHAVPPGEAGAVITTYETARMYLSAIHNVGYEMLILDEAHKLRNLYGVDPTPQVAVKFRKALSDRMFKYVLMLTATPIQNRLWDLYSLVDLLAVARGHENPFGSDGMFARKFIADNRQQARHLNPLSQDDFRAVVYSYMSRVRRDDADLHFPRRIVQTHHVDPTAEEIELIDIVSKSIEEFNRLAQISILQALVSSPEALSAQLNGMARKGTAPIEFASAVSEVVKRIHITSKLKGVAALVEELRKRQGEKWRMVIFTTRRETQTTIQIYLNSIGIKVGLINGDSRARNQDTILKFKQDTPEINVIISTEAGSQGVNLQSANVLVNYDLPWNPMIVEQRIGRVQRLASRFENVTIFNIVLKDTFEEFIVGRLMEKLQMASSAIGDIEALLEATDDDESDSGGFEEKIRHLVVESLKGKNIEKATKQAEESILQAKIRLEQEERNINALLGSMDGKGYKGPRNPRLPKQIRSMDYRDYSLKVIDYLNDKIKPVNDLQYQYTHNNRTEYFHFDGETPNNSEIRSSVLRPGTSLFERFVDQISSLDLHLVSDEDININEKSQKTSIDWVNSFDADFSSCTLTGVCRQFEGTALIKVKATVACDSYERLIEVECHPDENQNYIGPDGIETIATLIDNPTAIGINVQKIENKARQDEGIVEFCRFYNERRSLEVEATGDDERKKKRIEDEFTPRLDIILVGLKGGIRRLVKAQISFSIDDNNQYSSLLTLSPAYQRILEAPSIATCQETGKHVPENCITKCEISGSYVISHLLMKSEKSNRHALPKYTCVCALSGKRLLTDEVEKSDVSGEMIDKALLVTSALSGRRAEPNYFGVCAFSSTTVLLSELQTSQVSGKPYRVDQQLHSDVSSKSGHKDEFIYCSLSNRPLLPSEAEKCEVSGKLVMPGILDKCEVSGMKVMPSLLKTSAVSGKKALSKYFVESCISSAICLVDEAVKSVTGKFCLPFEAKACVWSGANYHPEDVSTCTYTMIQVHVQYLTHSLPHRLQALDDLLQEVDRSTDKVEVWSAIENQSRRLIDTNRCKVINAAASPKEEIVAAVIEVRTWGGLKVRYAGVLYSSSKDIIIGRYVIGKRDSKGWLKTDI